MNFKFYLCFVTSSKHIIHGVVEWHENMCLINNYSLQKPTAKLSTYEQTQAKLHAAVADGKLDERAHIF